MKKDAALDSTEIIILSDLADYLQCHPSTLYQLVNAGKIPAFRLGGEWRFRRSELDEWIARRQVSPAAGKSVRKPERRGRKRQKGL
jgi:excisionase family DNA binding protein